MGLDVSSQIILGVKCDEFYKYQETTKHEKRKIPNGGTQTIETTTLLEQFGNRIFNTEEDEFYEFLEKYSLSGIHMKNSGIIGIEIIDTGSHRHAEECYKEIDIEEFKNKEREIEFAEVLEKVGIPTNKMKYYLVTDLSY